MDITGASDTVDVLQDKGKLNQQMSDQVNTVQTDSQTDVSLINESDNLY